MSYVVIPNDVANADINNQVPHGIGLQFDGRLPLQSLYSVQLQAMDNLKNLLLTYPGERTGDWIAFGCRLKEIIFEPNLDEIKPDIEELIQAAVTRWIPQINIEDITIKTADDDPSLIHLITVAIEFTVDGSRFPQTLTLNTSGTGVITTE